MLLFLDWFISLQSSLITGRSCFLFVLRTESYQKAKFFDQLERWFWPWSRNKIITRTHFTCYSSSQHCSTTKTLVHTRATVRNIAFHAHQDSDTIVGEKFTSKKHIQTRRSSTNANALFSPFFFSSPKTTLCFPPYNFKHSNTLTTTKRWCVPCSALFSSTNSPWKGGVKTRSSGAETVRTDYANRKVRCGPRTPPHGVKASFTHYTNHTTR